MKLIVHLSMIIIIASFQVSWGMEKDPEPEQSQPNIAKEEEPAKVFVPSLIGPTDIHTFLAFNEQYHLSVSNQTELSSTVHTNLGGFRRSNPYLYDESLPPMPRLITTQQEIKNAAIAHDIDKFKKISKVFLNQLDLCEEHARHFIAYCNGRQQLINQCAKSLNYFDKVEKSLPKDQFDLNNQLIKTIKTYDNNNITDVLEKIKELLSQGASPESRDILTGSTALIHSIETVMRGTSYNFDINLIPSYNFDIFNCISSHTTNLNLPMYDIQNEKEGLTPLTFIAQKIKITKEYLWQKMLAPSLSSGIHVISQDINTLKKMLIELINKGADVNKADGYGRTVKDILPDEKLT